MRTLALLTAIALTGTSCRLIDRYYLGDGTPITRDRALAAAVKHSKPIIEGRVVSYDCYSRFRWRQGVLINRQNNKIQFRIDSQTYPQLHGEICMANQMEYLVVMHYDSGSGIATPTSAATVNPPGVAYIKAK